MARHNSGGVWTDPRTKQVFARFSFIDLDGKRKSRLESAPTNTRTEAKDLLPGLKARVLADLEARRKKALESGNAPEDDPDKPKGDKVTLRQLADYHTKQNLVPARRDKNHIKRRGLESWKDARRKVEALVQYFGPDLLARDLTFHMIEKYRRDRLSTTNIVLHCKRDAKGRKIFKRDSKTGELLRDEKGYRISEKIAVESEIAVGTVHRYLAALSSMMGVAVDEEWITKNPCLTPRDGRNNNHKKLIKPSEEKRRENIYTRAQENALLEACGNDVRQAHVKPLLIAYFDTGCRPVELSRLTFQDLDLDANMITVYSFKGIQRTQRRIALTSRLREVIENQIATRDPEVDFVFTYKHGKDYKPRQIKSIKRAFARLLRIAGLHGFDFTGFRRYDIRHTAATRLAPHLQSIELAKQLGHTQLSTVMRYVNPDDPSRQRAANILESYCDEIVLPFRKKRSDVA